MRIALIVVLLAAFGPLFAQNQSTTEQEPQASQPVRPKVFPPYTTIEDTASAMKPGDKDSVRAAAEAVFKLPQVYPMPDVMAAVVKQRLIDAQMAYLGGKSVGVVDGAVVDAINALATAFDAPDYAWVSLLQVQFIRSGTAAFMPIFMRSSPDAKLDEPNPPMSPLQAIVIIGALIDQKLINPDYHAAPAEWDRDFYPRLVAAMRARQELQRRIAAGEVQPKYEGRLVAGGPNEFETHVRQRIIAMSVADGLKLFNETFARLGIR
jgi:hypothetical protein